VLQCGAVCCVSNWPRYLPVSERFIVLQCVAVSCRGLQCVAVSCRGLQCAAVCCSVSKCVAVCCSVLQCVAFSIQLDICKTCCSDTHTHAQTHFIFEHIVVEFVGSS